jgi:peptide/nickel transport system ATP-binding protein
MSEVVAAPLIELRNISVSFRGASGVIRAVDDVSLVLGRGETLGLAGESGAGKSSILKAMLRLVDVDSGEVRFDGQDVTRASGRVLRPIRRRMQAVFQQPETTLNPRMRAGTSVAEPLRAHFGAAAVTQGRIAALFEQVGLHPDLADRYPHELSGGECQRVAVARALAVGPELLMLDEPTSGLDLLAQRELVQLLQNLRRDRGLAWLCVGHDLTTLRQLCDRVAVLHAGRVVEIGPASKVLQRPRHPYARALVASLPVPDPTRRTVISPLAGDPPDPGALPKGCAFHPRCPHAQDRCRNDRPLLVPLPGDDAHQVACLRSQELEG